jgi:hypothetical protein
MRSPTAFLLSALLCGCSEHYPDQLSASVDSSLADATTDASPDAPDGDGCDGCAQDGAAPLTGLREADGGSAEIVGTCDAAAEGQLIERGQDLNSECDELDYCSGGKLTRVHAASDAGSCPTPACPDASDGSGCVVDGVCGTAASYCACLATTDGGTRLYCHSESGDCVPRPRYGSPCVTSNGSSPTSCTFETCSNNGLDDIESCQDGFWHSFQIEDVCGP